MQRDRMVTKFAALLVIVGAAFSPSDGGAEACGKIMDLRGFLRPGPLFLPGRERGIQSGGI